MNDEELDALFKKALEAKHDTSKLEYGFETRLMARIRAGRESASIFGWAWRLCPYFAGVVVALGGWLYFSPQQIDLQAMSGNDSDDLQVVEYFTGDKI